MSPNTVNRIADGVRSLFGKGFRYVLQTLGYAAPWKDQHIKALIGQYLELAEFYAEALKSGENISYSPFDERIKTWAQDPYQPGNLCDLANSKIATAASGKLYPCVQFIGEDGPEDQGNSIGAVFDGFVGTRRQHFIEENYAEQEDFGGALYDFVQALLKITDVSYLSRDRIRSTFLEDLRHFRPPPHSGAV